MVKTFDHLKTSDQTLTDVEILFAIRALRVDILPISQIEGWERKGLIKEMGFNSLQNGVNPKLCSQ